MEYLLKASAVVVIFYICYKIFLQCDTFFQHNRSFLLLGLAISFLLPFLIIPIYIEYTPVDILPNYNFSDIPLVTQETEPKFNILDYLPIVYLLGIICFSVRFLIQMLSLSVVIYKNKKEKHGHYTHVKINKNLSPFSFFNWIVYNPKNFTKTELEQIITHEKVHANQKHSIDILLMQLSCITLWFNPFIWFYNKDLKQNLEFIADHETQQKFNCNKSYQTTLLKTSMPSHQMALTNNFYTSLIKKRIVMLHKSKSKKINLIKYAFVVPLLAVFLMSFNTKEFYVEKEATNASMDKGTTSNKFLIYNTFSTDAFKDFEAYLKSKGFDFNLKEIKRNTDNLITSIDFTITKNNVDGNYRIFGGGPLNTIVIEYFELDNKFIINRLDFAESHKDNNEKESLLKIVIDKNTTTNSLEKQKKFLKEKYDIDISFEILEHHKDKGFDTFTFKYGKGKEQSKVTSTNDHARVFIYSPKTNAFKSYSINKNGDPEYGRIGYLDSKHSLIIYNDYSDKSFKKYEEDLKEKGIIIKFINVKRNDKDEIIAIDISAKSKDDRIVNYNQNTNTPITPIAITYYGEGKSLQIGPSNFPINRGKNKTPKKSINKDSVIETLNKSTLENKLIYESINGKIDKHALYIIDNKESSYSDFEKIKKTNINTMNVFTGKDALDKYGDRGKNGVIEITTKNDTWQTNFIEGQQMNNVKVNSYGNPSEYAIFIKGISTTNGTSPFIIVDGKEFPHKKMKDLNPNDIESINILKDEKAIQKYGDRGKNSVIEIITKKK